MNMKKLILTIALTVLIGNPLIQGYFKAPTGETVFWKWFNKELGVIDSTGKCVWNTGVPRNCTNMELSKLLYYFKSE